MIEGEKGIEEEEGKRRKSSERKVRYPFRMYGTVTMKRVCQMQRPMRGKMPVCVVDLETIRYSTV